MPFRPHLKIYRSPINSLLSIILHLIDLKRPIFVACDKRPKSNCIDSQDNLSVSLYTLNP